METNKESVVEIKIEGKTYESIPEKENHSCTGCVLRNEAQKCQELRDSHASHICYDNAIIWIEKQTKQKGRSEMDEVNTEQLNNYETEEEIIVGGEYDTIYYGKVKVVYILQKLAIWKYLCISVNEEELHLSKEAFKLKKTVDWSKVPVDTRILVSMYDGPVKRHFCKYENGVVYFFGYGTTSWTKQDLHSTEESNVQLA